MQIPYESLIENRLYVGAEVEALLPLDNAAQSAAQPLQGLLDSLVQAQSAFSDSLSRYIEL
jgi:hypothetical protein